jgi:hypothetical protein
MKNPCLPEVTLDHPEGRLHRHAAQLRERSHLVEMSLME